MGEFDMPVNAALDERTEACVSPLAQVIRENPGKTSTPIDDSGKIGGSSAGAPLERHMQHHLFDPSPSTKRSPICSVPIEIILRIIQLIVSPRTRDGLYDLLKLTHVCKFWRAALINQPRAWSTVFITPKDCRSFVEACLERSHPVALDVTVDARKMGRVRPDCTCDKGRRERLLPNESNPCEWHFQFESLAETRYSNRIRALELDFDGVWGLLAESVEKVHLGLGSCRFFTSSFPQLTTLTWKNEDAKYVDNLFSTSPLASTSCSLTYMGSWDGLTGIPVNNLTSFAFESDFGACGVDVEDVRSFLLNNHSLESLAFKYVEFTGNSLGPPVRLSNLKLLNVGFADSKLSTIIRVPAFQHLSSLQIGSDEADVYALHATGDGIAFSAECSPNNLAETWKDFTGYAGPIIRHIHLDDSGLGAENHGALTFFSLLSDAHILEIGETYFPDWYYGFLDDLKQLGPQLQTIRFAIPEYLEVFLEDDYGARSWDDELLDDIEDLVRYRFDQGRPLSAVERMVTSKNERTNRERDFIWRCFYNDRQLYKYLRPK